MCDANDRRFLESLSKCALKRYEKPDVLRVLPLAQWFKPLRKRMHPRNVCFFFFFFFVPFQRTFDNLCKDYVKHPNLGLQKD